MKKMSTRLGFGISACVLAATVSSLALADATGATSQARGQCAGEHEHAGKRTPEERAKHAAERFKRADKNADGFLTQAEVGDKRWNRLQVADANKDGKVSATELAQARAEGKLGHGKRDKQPA